MPTNHHINPRFRAYGKARIDVTRRARDENEWQSLWREPLNPFPFEFPGSWKFCIEYRVDDYAAEVGFFIDILGFPVIAFSPSYAQFTTPEEGFRISVAAVKPGDKSTDPDTLRMQFMVEDILETTQMLEQRGIVFEHKPESLNTDTHRVTGTFRTPHGVRVDLCGEVLPKPDIHTLMEEDEEDDGEADRIIQQLLTLSISEGDEREEIFDEDETELGEDLIEEHRPPVSGSKTDEVEQETPAQDPPPPKSDAFAPAGSSNLRSSQAQKGNNYPRTPGRRESPSWSEDGHRGNGELTYHEIEDDASGLAEDGF